VPHQSEPASKNPAQNGPHSHCNAPTNTEVPDRRKIDEEARIGRQTSQEPSDDQKSSQIVGIVMAQGTAQEPGRDENTHEIDPE
jgi:hypothetical protein